MSKAIFKQDAIERYLNRHAGESGVKVAVYGGRDPVVGKLTKGNPMVQPDAWVVDSGITSMCVFTTGQVFSCSYDKDYMSDGPYIVLKDRRRERKCNFHLSKRQVAARAL